MCERVLGQRTKLHVECDMCVMLCYVMLCVRLLRSWVSRG